MTSADNIKSSIKEHLDSALFCIENPAPTYQGKVRDIYDRGSNLVMVTSDRVSAFDRVLGTIPLKGALLCEQAHHWFKQADNVCPTHFVDRPDPQILVVKKAMPIKVEVIVRGFLAGSLMREDKMSRGQAYGLKLDPNLSNYQRFFEPIITPTTKGAVGEHDLPLSGKQIVESGLLNAQQWEKVKAYSLDLFKLGSRVAENRGLYLVDTKYEFGYLNEDIILIDEIHTSDSSRFFLMEDYAQKMASNIPPLMLDKEFLRQHILATLGPDAPHHLDDYILTDEVRMELASRYWRLTEQLTGLDFIAPKTGAKTRVPDLLGTNEKNLLAHKNY